MKMVNGFPRRNRVECQTDAEKAITAAMHAVEASGCHPLLTDAVILLGQAKDKVGDFVDRDEPVPDDIGAMLDRAIADLPAIRETDAAGRFVRGTFAGMTPAEVLADREAFRRAMPG